MSIRFDREQVQQLWQQRGQGKAAESTLGKALADDKLTRQEYEAIKKEFETANPGEDFDKFLSDALDGQLDAKVNPEMLAMVSQLGKPGSAAASVSLQLNESRSGFNDPRAISFDKRDWVQAALASDADKNGRIDGAELSGLSGKLDEGMMAQLRAGGSVLTYDAENCSMTFYPAPDAPTLHARYRDLKAELDINLRDVDGITDRSKSDLSGSASGTLSFDWGGPLVSGIRQAVVEKTGGWVDMDARWVPAGDRDGYGPGYVIQARSGIVATRPIVIKTDPAGQLFLESPGFGSWARLKMGEYGLEKYALPQLKAMGFELDIENKDGRIYLRPKTLQINNIPLSAQVAGGGQLNLGLGGHTRFTAGPNGLRASFDNVSANGSSNVAGPQASPDRNAQGAETPDTLKARVRAGLNYNVQQGKLDTQVVVDKAEAELHLDQGEVASVPYIPADARKLAGETVDGKLKLQGSYRTVNGSEHEGSLQGQVEITNRKGDETTDIFSRFQTKASQRDPNLAVNLSAVDVRHTRPGQEVRVRAEGGTAKAGAKGPDLALQQVKAQVRLSEAQLANVRKLLDEQHIGSAQFLSACKAVGITSEQLKILSEGSKEQISKLLSSSELAKKLKQALLKVDADKVNVGQSDKGITVSGEGIKASGEAGDGQGTRLKVDAKAASAGATVGPKVEVKASEADIKTDISSQRSDGTLTAQTRLQAAEVDVAVAGDKVDLAAKGALGSGAARAVTANGAEVGIKGDIKGLDMSRSDGKFEASAAGATGSADYATPGGTRISAEARLGKLSLSQKGAGEWVLSSPDAKGAAKLEMDVAQLRKLVNQLSADAVSRLAKDDPAAQRTFLEKAGLSPDEIRQASELFANPQLQALLSSSDLTQVLAQGKTVRIETVAEGNLTAGDSSAGVTLESQGTVKAKAQVLDAAGRTLIDGKANAEQATTRLDAQGLSVSTPKAEVKLDGTRADGSRFGQVSAEAEDVTTRFGKANEVRTGKAEGKLSSTSQAGTRIDADIRLDKLDFKQGTDGAWTLSIPNQSTRAQVEMQVGELQRLVKDLGAQTVTRLATERDPESLRAALVKAGLGADKAKQAAELLWRPELRSLMATSEFATALEQGKTIRFEVSGSGSIDAKAAPGQGVSLTGKGKVDAQGSLRDDKGQELLGVKAGADQVTTRIEKGEVSVETPALDVVAEGRRADGSPFAVLTARAQDLRARLGVKGGAATSGPISAELSGQTKLDAEKIKEVQNLLSDFRDELVTRLQKLGLSREQFEQILKAFGRDQIETLLKSFKPDSIANLSNDLGLSKEQIEQTLSLLNDAAFSKQVQEFFRFSELLNDSQAQVHVKLDSTGGSWSQRDGQMMAELKDLTGKLQVDTSHEKGTGHFELSATQDSLRYRDDKQLQGVEWGAYSGTAKGELKESDGSRRAEAEASVRGDAGHLGQNGNTVTSSFGKVEVSGRGSQQLADGTTGTLEGKLSVGGLETKRDVRDPNSAEMKVTDLKGRVGGTIDDKQARQTIKGQARVGIDEVKVSPQQMETKKLEVEARVASERDFEKGQQAAGVARVKLGAETITSSEQDGVNMPRMDFEGTGQATISRDGKQVTRMKFEGANGAITDLRAKDGTVEIGGVRTDASADLQTPMVRGGLQGELKIDGIKSTPEATTAQGFAIDNINGTLKVKTDRLMKAVAGNKDAKAILQTISERWGTGANRNNQIFTNDEITLQIDKGSIKGDAKDGNALKDGTTVTGRLRLPDLNTRLMNGKAEIELRNLSLAENARTQVEVVGSAEFKPNQPEFNQSVQSLVETHMKSIGVDLKPSVSYEGGQFKVKIDRWFVDGLLSVDFEGDAISIKVDRAKLLGFISARNLTARFSESKINNYLLDIDRKGDTLRLSLNEFSQQLLHKDNLQIQGVETRPDNTIKLKFAYTDTPAYNADFAKRQQTRLDERLFKDPRTGKPRSNDQIEDVIEELEAVRLRPIFQQGSPAQLRRILESVGKDYDDILRKMLAGETRYDHYPVANRAVMAAYLASDKGIFESVDSEERAHIQKFIASLKPGERKFFDQALSAEERARVEKFLAPAPKRTQPQHPKHPRGR